ncbi:hypothetical protein [Flexithrix dorotheae]|uniref:hypothetical protein n=1 Tax=Flexithrix dorotheae TaxID=70993 RepID=UPI00036A5DCA|nr:hypothetical protein [Flexithrix dorotheae]
MDITKYRIEAIDKTYEFQYLNEQSIQELFSKDHWVEDKSLSEQAFGAKVYKNNKNQIIAMLFKDEGIFLSSIPEFLELRKNIRFFVNHYKKNQPRENRIYYALIIKGKNVVRNYIQNKKHNFVKTDKLSKDELFHVFISKEKLILYVDYHYRSAFMFWDFEGFSHFLKEIILNDSSFPIPAVCVTEITPNYVKL